MHDVLPTTAVVSAVEPPPQHDEAAAIIVAATWTSSGSRLLTGFAVSHHMLLDYLPVILSLLLSPVGI